MLSW
ncbi:hypothetical protein E2C01_081113 [Portunus trituberculatus]|jgi:hypothetical protein